MIINTCHCGCGCMTLIDREEQIKCDDCYGGLHWNEELGKFVKKND